MGIREQLNENPRLTVGIMIGVIVIVLAFVFWRGGDRGTPAYARSAFFTDDDGKTWFVDDVNRIPPFEHDKKQAVRAYVYKCGGKTFVNHLERFTADAKKKLEQIPGDDLVEKLDPSVSGIGVNNKEVKAPGQRVWVNVADPKAAEVLRIKCDNPSDAQMVLP